MLKVFEQITGLKKAATKRDAERKELADVIEQERLIEMKSEWRSKQPMMPQATLLIISPYTV
jgi:nucleosome binding factor SPN SPT16 subunit